MIYLVGPFVAAVGLVVVFFVMRHRSVQTKSMYSARRGQIERKVRAARQRTLAPTGKHTEKEDAAQVEQTFAAPGMEAKTAAPTATWGPPTVGPAPQAPPAPPAPQPVWEVGPTVPPPAAPEPTPPPPPFTPSEPAYTPPPPAPAEEWVPAAVQPVAPREHEPTPPPIEPRVAIPAGGGSSWSIVGDSKEAAEPDDKKKSKKDKDREKQGQEGAWQLASGLMPGDEAGEEIKGPSKAMAIAQYVVLVLGLGIVLMGVVVMLANSHVT